MQLPLPHWLQAEGSERIFGSQKSQVLFTAAGPVPIELANVEADEFLGEAVNWVRGFDWRCWLRGLVHGGHDGFQIVSQTAAPYVRRLELAMQL